MEKLEIKNWKKYGFEFLSIFIAVISAFALDNWNDNRRNHNAENKILTEIYNGLEKDLEDLQLNETGHKMGIKATIYFKDLLANKQVPKDSFMIHYFNLTRDFISIQNISGYETLKSKGLELIQNDSLRKSIISIYEYDYNALRKLEEDYEELQFQKNYFKEINHSFSKNFIFDENKTLINIKTPLDIPENEQKTILLYLWKIQANRNFILHYYSEVKGRVEKLRKDINVELKR